MNRILLTLLTVVLLISQSASGQTTGPASGSLVIVGGGMQDPAIVKRFMDLAGGMDAPIVVIPTAGGGEHYDEFYQGLNAFRNVGATNVTVLHTTDRQTANSAEFVQPLLDAHGVWFGGGRQWRLVDAYMDTRVHSELDALLDRGGVIGGSSAGATIQGSYLARGDTKTNTIMMGDHEEGLAFIKNVAIDQHLLKRNRQFDLIEIIEAKPELLGIGIDEDTAVVVRGNNFEVMGSGYVAIYDANKMIDSGGQFYLLAAGDRYNMATRTATRPGRSMQPVERVVERKWDN